VLGAVLLPLSLAAQERPGDDFGRWERTLRRCRIHRSPGDAQGSATETCRLLRLDQQMEGLLTVRFLQPGGMDSFLNRQLVFAGVLEEGSAGMHCRGSRCEPQWPLRLRVSAVGQAGYGPVAPPVGLPRAELASGHCELEARAYRCEATTERRQWRVEAGP
jgi:hypothetical protein